MANLLLFPPPDIDLPPPPALAPDHAERERALDVRGSFIVEAPAGSGKTGLLIQRFLKLLATVDDPAQVLAITFTRKATAELADRVLRQLSESAASRAPANSFDDATRPLAEAVLTRDAQLGWNLLDQPRRLNIRTIDSVCADIAATLPILSGSGGGQSPSDDAASLYAEAARRTLALLGGPDPTLNQALRTILLHRDGNLSNCEALIASMLGARDQWGELVPLADPALDDATLDREVLPRLEKALDLAICQDLTRLNKGLPGPMLQSLCALAAEMGHAEGYQGASSPLAVCAGKFTPPDEKAAHLDHWLALIDLLLTKDGEFRKSLNRNHLKFLIEKNHKQELADLIDQVRHDDKLCELLCSVRALPPTHYPADQWRVAKALFQVLSRALTELQAVFAARDQCDFPEIALLAKAALRTDSAQVDLAAAGPALEHLLVDEMQDTSTTQYELIQLLTRGWDGLSRTIFLVGDPKQSIYLFRQARVERFVQTMHRGRLGDLPLAALHLTANFRSQANLVQAFNRDFAAIFPSATDLAEPASVPYRAADATREPASAASVVWHLQPLAEGTAAAERNAQATQDAQAIRRIIEDWRANHRGPHPPKIAVLVQSRTHLLPIVRAFKQATPIPYRAVQIEPLGERQEILDLVALTRALLHPADRTAWFALLRTPLCGLTLADLHLLAGADDHAFAQHTVLQLLQQRGDLLSADGIARLEPFWQILEAALHQRGRLPLSQLVHRTWRAFGAHQFLDPDGLLNVNQYLSLLEELETSTGVLPLERLEKRLGKLYAAPSSQPDAVDLMTIHNAKGLEWDLVLVPSLERSGRSNETRLLDWIETDADNELKDASVAHGILAPIQSKGGDSGRLNQWIQSIYKTREAAERKRLFYVACTRAREQVHLFAAPQTKVDGALSAGSRNLLAAAWPAAQAHLSQPEPADNLLSMPGRPQPQVLDTVAAVALPERSIDRIPVIAMKLPPRSPAPSADEPLFARPEGSFRARVFGKTLHTLLEKAATSIAAGSSFPALLSELPSWSARVAAVLRAGGLAGRDLEALTPQALRGLQKTLASAEGRWLLSAHPQAASERGLNTWDEAGQAQTSLRLDRTFLAGPAPLAPGADHLWIVDYKTSTHAETGLDAWLDQQRELYREQLETYAHALAGQTQPLRLALYFPLLSRLVWWPA